MDDVFMERSRRALELGRVRTALIGASILTLGLAALSLVLPRPIDPRWLALPFVAWTFVAWRGGALVSGGMLGVLAGAAGWLVPMSVLRPCCAAMSAQAMETGADCCTRPDCCLEAGALLGVVVALLAPIDLSRGRRAFGVQVAGLLAMAGSTLGVRCTGLFVGEALGLLGGLVVAALAVTCARALLTRPLAA